MASEKRYEDPQMEIVNLFGTVRTDPGDNGVDYSVLVRSQPDNDVAFPGGEPGPM